MPRAVRIGLTMVPPGSLAPAIIPQLTAFFRSALILASSLPVNSLSAKVTGHRAPSSRFALSLNPTVAYLVLNFCALWKKQMTWPSSLAYAGIPYQVFAERAGAVSLMMAWSLLAMARSGSFIAAIAASAALSPSDLSLVARASAFSSCARAFITARSSSVNPLDSLPAAVVFLPDFWTPFFGFIETSLRVIEFVRRPASIISGSLSRRCAHLRAEFFILDVVRFPWLHLVF